MTSQLTRIAALEAVYGDGRGDYFVHYPAGCAASACSCEPCDRQEHGPGCRVSYVGKAGGTRDLTRVMHGWPHKDVEERA